MKTICFDLRALQIGHENRGIGMYIRSVLEHLPPQQDTNYVFYCFDKGNPVTDLGIKLQFEYSIVTTPTVKTALDSPKNLVGALKLVGHRFKKLRHHKPDVFVQFDFTLGIPRWRKTKTVVIGYDLIPLIQKNHYLPTPLFAWQHSRGKKGKLRAVIRASYYRIKYRFSYKVYKRADHIIAISQSTAQSFVDMLGINPAKISSIPLAPVLSDSKPDNSILSDASKPYVLYIGGTDNRKRIQDIVVAFNIARGRGANLQLVLAGKEFETVKTIPDVAGRHAILDSPYKKDIILVGFVSDAQKKALYEHAHAFVFCSSYEGFGLPIIEAMQASCPVISYDNSSIPEAAGGAALLVPTADYIAVAEAILALNDTQLRKKLIAKGIIQARKFSWKRYTEAFTKALSRA